MSLTAVGSAPTANRGGKDIAFAVGIALVFLKFGSIEFSVIFPAIAQHQADTYTVLGRTFPAFEVIGVLLFIGAMGKSAQIGLHVWLPDAMEGPTPVSALIHAATMVTAGVFLIARMSPLYEFAPFALGMVTLIGASTALFAATVGCAAAFVTATLPASAAASVMPRSAATGCQATTRSAATSVRFTATGVGTTFSARATASSPSTSRESRASSSSAPASSCPVSGSVSAASRSSRNRSAASGVRS